MKKLTKSNNKMIAGVCAGLAEYMDVDPTVIRVIYMLMSVFFIGFPGILIYLILCILIPNQGQS